MGISYCLKGYFYGIRRTKIIIASEVLELLIKTAAVITLVNKLLPLGIEWGCAAVAIGLCVGEICSCLFLCFNSKDVIFKADDKIKTYPVMPIVKICLPVIIGACLSRILRMQEEVFMVSSLSKFGLSNSSALENLGVLQGMIMPVLIFPITLIGALVTTVIPEISRAQASQNSVRMKNLLFKLYGFAVVMGICTTALLIIFSDVIAFNIYNNAIVAEMVRKMAFLVPIMLLDSISCAVLNGLGKQTGLLFIGLGDSFLRLAIVYALVPYMGMAAVYGMIIFSNLFTCLLSVTRVLNLTRSRKNVITKLRCPPTGSA